MGAVFSVRFSMTNQASSLVNEVMQLFQTHRTFKTYRVFFPNAFSKGFCGAEADITNLDGHCFGKCCMKCKWGDKCDGSGTANEEPCFQTQAETTNHSCWAFGFRKQQERAAANRGFMLQLSEACRSSGALPRKRMITRARTGLLAHRETRQDLRFEYPLGAGQIIESHMAREVGLKVFRVQAFNHIDLDLIEKRVQVWRAAGCRDMEPEVINCTSHQETAIATANHPDSIGTGQAPPSCNCKRFCIVQ